MKFGSLCALGGLTPLPVLSALKYFPEDFGLTPSDVDFIGADLTISTSGAGSSHAIASDSDFATPLRPGARTRRAGDRRTRRRRARRHFGDPRGGGGRNPHPETLRDRFARAVRLVPSVPGRNRRPARLPRVVHHARARRDEGAHREPRARAPASRRDGAVHFRSSARLPDLSRQRQLRAAGHGGRGRSARSALPQRRRREPSPRGEGSVESVFHFRSVEMHRVLAMRPRVRGSAGHLRADDRRARIFVGDFAGTERPVLGVRMRFVRRVRASVSDRDA